MRFIIFILLALPFTCQSQNFKRIDFDYNQLDKSYTNKCDKSKLEDLNLAFQAINNNNSSQAVSLSKPAYEKYKNCHFAFEVYAFSLFRNGKRLEGVRIIEEGISKLGSVPELIKRRSEMSIELGETGPGAKRIDGNVQYKGGSEFDEEQYKKENNRSALQDLSYLYNEYGRDEEQYLIGMLHQKMGAYSKSNAVLEHLRKDTSYGPMAIFNMADNYIQLKQPDKALKELTSLEKQFLENPMCLVKFKKFIN